MVMSGCRIGRKCRSSDAYSMIDYYSRMPRHVRKGCKCKRQRSLSFHPPQTGSLLYKSGRLLVSVPSQSLRMSKTTNALFCYGLNPFTCLFGSSTRPNTSIEECDTPFPLKKNDRHQSTLIQYTQDRHLSSHTYTDSRPDLPKYTSTRALRLYSN